MCSFWDAGRNAFICKLALLVRLFSDYLSLAIVLPRESIMHPIVLFRICILAYATDVRFISDNAFGDRCRFFV